MMAAGQVWHYSNMSSMKSGAGSSWEAEGYHRDTARCYHDVMTMCVCVRVCVSACGYKEEADADEPH